MDKIKFTFSWNMGNDIINAIESLELITILQMLMIMPHRCGLQCFKCYILLVIR